MTETKRLGRGLEALLGPVSREQAEASGALRELPLSSIKPNPYQPRTRMDPTELTDLASSMKASGLLQPVVVRPHDNGFELIAGERRWRAAQQLGWPRIPAVVREVDDRTLLTLALIENLQRDDLSPIDEAAGYRRLGEEFQLRTLGNRQGRGPGPLDRREPAPSPPAAARRPDHGARETALCGTCPSPAGPLGHRATVGFGDGGGGAGVVRARGRGRRRRETERPRPSRRANGQPAVPNATAEVKRVEDALRKRLGTDVRVTARRRGRGFVTISYYSNDDLSRLLELILGGQFEG